MNTTEAALRDALAYAASCLCSVRKNYEEENPLWADVSKAIKQGNEALSQPSPASSTAGEVRVLPGANSHVFDMRLVIGEGDAMERGDGGECIAFADEPWASRIAAALSPSSGEPASVAEQGNVNLSHEAAIKALCDCAATVTVLSYQEVIEGYFSLRGLPIPGGVA